MSSIISLGRNFFGSESDKVKVVSRTGGSTVTVNGKSWSGNSVSVVNNRIFVDGKEVDNENDVKKIYTPVTIKVSGDCETVESQNGNITIEGSAGSAESTNGEITVEGDVTGSVKTTNGNVFANCIRGGVKTVNGDIKH